MSMTNTTIPESKDQFGETLEQLRKVQAARRACFRAIQDAKHRAWEWRDRRDELRGETPAIHERITGERQERDEINTEVQRLKRLRNEEIERARILQEKLQILRGKLTGATNSPL